MPLAMGPGSGGREVAAARPLPLRHTSGDLALRHPLSTCCPSQPTNTSTPAHIQRLLPRMHAHVLAAYDPTAGSGAAAAAEAAAEALQRELDGYRAWLGAEGSGVARKQLALHNSMLDAERKAERAVVRLHRCALCSNMCAWVDGVVVCVCVWGGRARTQVAVLFHCLFHCVCVGGGEGL